LQSLGQLRVLGQEAFPVNDLPAVQALHVLAQHFLQQTLL
jgi:hypothetical protein